MARSGKSTTARTSGSPGRTRPGQQQKRKSCFLCKDKVDEVDYKNVNLLRRYMSDRGKIRNRRMTGACRKHQRQVALAIKRAREMALLPYSAPPGAPAPKGRSGGDRSRDRERDAD
jgi:small subunit ribosomal protein S18